MSSIEKKNRMYAMQQKIEQADIFHWAKKFLNILTESVTRRSMNVCTPVSGTVLQKIDMHYTFANSRLLLLDYDGTMVPFYKNTQDAYPDRPLLTLLEKLTSDIRNKVVVISGRDNVTLEKWLGHLNLAIVAEHGAWVKEKGGKWQSIPGLQTEWKETISDTFAAYTAITPGAFVEEKAYSIAWHYRVADSRSGAERAQQIIDELKRTIDTASLDIIHGNKVIEVKNNAVNKGKAAMKFISKQKYDFILAIGDDTTDEDMFKVMPKAAISIKVGSKISAASYCQNSYMEVRALLQRLYENSGKIIDRSGIQLAS
jgi:trehalose 6-phosphate synthase/phosphatase